MLDRLPILANICSTSSYAIVLVNEVPEIDDKNTMSPLKFLILTFEKLCMVVAELTEYCELSDKLLLASSLSEAFVVCLL